MGVSKIGLKTFKELYAARFREDLNEADNFRKAQKLLNIFEAIYGDPFEVDIEELQTNEQNESSGSSENKQADSEA